MISRAEKDWKLLLNRSDPTIPPSKILNLGWQFTASFLVVQVLTRNQRDTWQAGGRIWATANVRGYVTRFYTHELDLFAQELIVVPNLFQEKYSLYYRAPKFFTNVQLKIWEYIGENSTDPFLAHELINSLVEQNQEIVVLLQDLLDKVNHCLEKDSKLTLQQKGVISHLIL